MNVYLYDIKKIHYLFFRVKVSGESMWSKLIPGKTCWASSLLPIRLGDIVIAQSPDGIIVKRLVTITADSIELAGTVSWSSNYTLPKKSIVGRLIVQ